MVELTSKSDNPKGGEQIMSDLLTLDRIEELLATSKTGKGTYKRDIQNFVDSEELYVRFSDLPSYKGKDAQATKNSIRGNIEKHGKKEEWPDFNIILDRTDPEDVGVVLVNMSVFATEKAAQNDTTDEQDVEPTEV